MDQQFDNPRLDCLRSIGAVIALSLALGLVGLTSSSALLPDVARADVIDEYEEPPPPAPEPEPEPTPGGDKPAPSGGSGSQSGSGGSYSYDSGYVAPAPVEEKGGKPKRGDEKVSPEPREQPVVALESSSDDSSFLSAAFGGVGWLLPGLMLAIAIGAVVWMRFDRLDSASPRAPRKES